MSGKARRRLSQKSNKRRFLNKIKSLDLMKSDLFRECVLLGSGVPSPSFHPIHRGWEITSIASARPRNTVSLFAILELALCVVSPLTWVDTALPMGGIKFSPTFNLPWVDKERSMETIMMWRHIMPFLKCQKRRID